MDLSKNLCFLYRKEPMFVNPLQNFVTADQFCTSQDCVTKGFPHVSKNDNLLFSRKQAIPGKTILKNGKHVLDVQSESNCKDICILIKDCEYFSWHQTKRECFLHKEASHLRYNPRVIGGEVTGRKP